jgi:hypothetical protein
MSQACSSPSSERDMVGHMLPNIADRFAATHLGVEVRSHGRSRTDVVFVAGDEVIGVEVKMTDWRRAIFQALLNRYCVDRSYIALWTGRVTTSVLTEALEWGVGVLAISATAIEIVQPAPANQPEPVLRDRIRAALATYA